MANDVTNVYEQHVRPLSDSMQLQLVGRIVDGITQQQQARATTRRSVMELHGKGAELWQGVDAATYVDELRSEWD
jgi:hypothetical protein